MDHQIPSLLYYIIPLKMERIVKPFTENAEQIIRHKYLFKDPQTLEIQETIDEFFPRVAKAIANIDRVKYNVPDSKVKRFEQKLLNAMDAHRVIPAGRTLANAGLDTSVIPNCVVLDIDDSLKSIFQTLKDACLLQQMGSGIGFCFSDMREVGSIVSKSRSTSSGPISFLRVFHQAFSTIQQQSRSGANMATFSITHPDILEFLDCKTIEGDIYTFNISVLITDAFMEQATNSDHPNYNNPWMCFSKGKQMKPRQITRGPYCSVKIEEVEITAHEILNKIAYNGWRNAEPGVLFIDEGNRTNPLPGLGPIKATNPCVTEDCWIMTNYGPKMVKDLIARNDFFIHLGKKDKYSTVHSNGFFPTGIHPVYLLETKEGFSIKITETHRFLNPNEKMVYVKDLQKGDKLILSNFEHDWKGKGTFNQGYMLGQIKGNGYLSETQGIFTVYNSKQKGDRSHIDIEKILDDCVFTEYGTRYNWNAVTGGFETGVTMGSAPLLRLANKYGMFQGDKKVSNEIEMASKDFYIGFLRGFFDADGSIQGDSSKGRSIRLNQSSLECLQRVQRMLLRLGIKSIIYLRRPAQQRLMPTHDERGLDFYPCQNNYDLCIANDCIIKFEKIVGLYHTKKKELLNQMVNSFKRTPNASKYLVRVEKITLIGEEKVYNITTKNKAHTYQSNGLISANCGEQLLHNGDVCCLIGINLAEYYNETEHFLNWKIMAQDLRLATHMGDNVIDMYDVKRVPRVSEAIQNNRRIGIGPMGFADLCIKMKIVYGSEECIRLIKSIGKLWRSVTIEKSRRLAEIRGAFPNWHKSIYYQNNEPYRRNAALTNAAPTGTISRVVNASSGIEPNFAFMYKSNIMGKIQNTFHYLLEKELKDSGIELTDDLFERIKNDGSLQKIDEIPENIKRIFVGAMDLSVEAHIAVQATWQKYLENSISKTINYPEEATVEDVLKGYVMAWKSKCKGFTLYRNNSRFKQVLETGKKKQTETAQIAATSNSDPELNEQTSPSIYFRNCKECDSPKIISQEGCVRCTECDWTPCS